MESSQQSVAKRSLLSKAELIEQEKKEVEEIVSHPNEFKSVTNYI